MVQKVIAAVGIPLVLAGLLITSVLYLGLRTDSPRLQSVEESDGLPVSPNVHGTKTVATGISFLINELLEKCPSEPPTQPRPQNSDGRQGTTLKRTGFGNVGTKTDQIIKLQTHKDVDSVEDAVIQNKIKSNTLSHEINKVSNQRKETAECIDAKQPQTDETPRINYEDASTSNPGTTKFVQKTGGNATTVICHILLGALLLASACIALFEVCRDRLTEKINNQAVKATINTVSTPDTRRVSLADLTVSRHARRESVQQQHHHHHHHLQTAASFDSSTGPPSSGPGQLRSQMRLLGARPPPLQRRSSFPVAPLQKQQSIGGLSVPIEQSRSPSGSATPTKLSRRPSADQSEEDSSPDTRRRVRIIRRH